jgi:multidrug efflux pump subunit AcrA (membrane-fusion protein)
MNIRLILLIFETALMKLRHIIIIAIFVLINVGVFMTLNFGGNKTEEDTKEEVKFVQSVEAQAIENTTENFSFEAYGTVSSFQSVDISSEIQGKLIQGKKDLKPGVTFRKGELLFRFNDVEARLNIRSRKSAYINIIANMLPDIKVDFPSEFDKWNDYINSIKLNESIPQLPSWKSNKEKIFISTRNVLTEYFAIKGLEEQLKKFYVRAPFSGLVTMAYVSEHSVINPGTKVLTLVATGDFELAVSVPVSQLGDLQIGSTSKIYTSTGRLKGEGKVVRISEVINKSTQSVDVYIKPIPNENEKFIEGEYIKVAIDQAGEFSGCRIPEISIFDNQVYTYSKADSSLSIKKVMVLNENSAGVFVSGLNNKDIVITQEVLNVSDSSKYEVVIK